MSVSDAPGEPQSGERTRRADVELRLPADNAYASVLRTTTAGLAARLDFTIDDIEDLRIAVGEASAMVLPHAVDGSDLDCRFYLGNGALTVTVGVGVDHLVDPAYESFAWQVLTTLATAASADCSTDEYSISLTMESGSPGTEF